MSVQKIFMTLIIVVACVILGAFALNSLLPNVIAGLSSSAEQMLQNATGISFDMNGDGTVGKTTEASKGTQSSAGAGVSGYGDGDNDTGNAGSKDSDFSGNIKKQ